MPTSSSTLAGSPTIGNPYSKRWARNLRESRVTTTRTLAEAIAGSTKKPAFVAGNAIAIYGDHGDVPVTEASDSRGHALMADVTRVWEAAAQPARAAGARVCVLRTAPVMDRESQPLAILRRLFRLGLGGRIGSGRQYFPMVSLRDWLAAVVYLAEHDSVSGPINVCCPETPTNAEFTRALAHAVGRPAFVAVPSARDPHRRRPAGAGAARLGQPRAPGTARRGLRVPRPGRRPRWSPPACPDLRLKTRGTTSAIRRTVVAP